MKRFEFVVTAAVLLGCSSAFAQGPQEVDGLMKSGYASVGNNVWERVEADGVVHRVGFGLESKGVLLDRLKSYETQLKSAGTQESDIFALLAMSSIVTSIEEHIHLLEEAQSSENSANTKASGNFNGCTSGSISPSTSVNTAARTANSTVGFTGFGPGAPGVVRLVFSFSLSGGAPDIDVSATYGSTFGPTTSVSSSTTGTGSCQLYAYGHSFNVLSGCGRWSDSYFSGTC